MADQTFDPHNPTIAGPAIALGDLRAWVLEEYPTRSHEVQAVLDRMIARWLPEGRERAQWLAGQDARTAARAPHAELEERLAVEGHARLHEVATLTQKLEAAEAELLSLRERLEREGVLVEKLQYRLQAAEFTLVSLREQQAEQRTLLLKHAIKLSVPDVRLYEDRPLYRCQECQISWYSVRDAHPIDDECQVEAALRAPSAPPPQADWDVCRSCGHYRSTHGATCNGWMPATSAHTSPVCSCLGFVAYPPVAAPPPQENQP